MKNYKLLLTYFSKEEWMLWLGSIATIMIFFNTFDGNNHLSLLASLVGVTALIYNAKGNPFGQFLMVIFSLLYGMISYTFAYYGEMITYLGMTLPMAFFAWISWMRNPYDSNKREVKVNHLTRKEYQYMAILTILVTATFYFILNYFQTSNMIFSTLSVATSFVAVYLTFRRSPYYAMGYAANDIVLIILWLLATKENIAYISVTVCFVMFFINDIYGFMNWQKIGKSQIQ